MPIRRSLAWMMVSQGGLFILQFGGSVVLARLLTPYEMGIYAVAVAMMGALGIVQAFGLTLFVVREADIDREVMATAFTINVVLALLLAGAVAGLSVFGGVFLHEPGVQRVLLVLTLSPVIGILEFLPAANLERNAEFSAIALMTLLRAATLSLVTVSLAVCGFSYMSFAWGSIAGACMSAAGFTIAGRRYVSFRLGFTGWQRILRFGMQQLAINGVTAFASRMADLMVGRLLGLNALGLYSRASSLNSLLWYNIHMVVGRVILVDFAGQRRQGTNLRDSYLMSLEILTAMLWPGFTGLAILAGPLIFVIYGKAWVAAAPALSALAVSSAVLVSLTMTWEVFVVCGETHRQARFEFIRAAIGLVVFSIGCLISLTAAAGARIVEALFAVTLYRPHMERMTSTRRADFLPVYRRSAILTIAACSPALALMALYSWSAYIPVALTLVTIVAGVTAWLAALRLMDHILLGEIRHLVTKGRKVSGLTHGAAASVRR
jgi:O-antigen/teichoic acid export membrane protein